MSQTVGEQSFDYMNIFIFPLSLEAMQCPDVVVANLDTNGFSSNQTVHVNEVELTQTCLCTSQCQAGGGRRGGIGRDFDIFQKIAVKFPSPRQKCEVKYN